MTRAKNRIVAIDLGRKRIGLALSDQRGLIALPLTTVPAGKKIQESARNILKVLAPYQEELKLILVGLPLLLNGTSGEMANEAKQFAEVLRKIVSIPVELIDERLSSKGAERALLELGMKRKERSKHSDETAALLILQTYLDTAISKTTP